jgi:hypothetical protein
MRTPKTITGYTHMPHETFRKELDEWIEQIKEGCSEQEISEMMYDEMGDWLDDNVLTEKDEIWYDVPIVVHLNEDGVVTIKD